MSRIGLAAILLSTLCLAAQAAAKIPDRDNSEVPGLLTLVARGADGSADPLGTFTIVIRDFNNVPMENEDVVLAFHETQDIRLCADQGDPNVVVDCANRWIRARTDANGRITFRVIGCATNRGLSPGSTGPSLQVYAEGVWLETVRVAALDQDGLDGVNPGDLSLWLGDYFSSQMFARSDYDGDGVLSPNDLSLWLAAFFAGGSAVSGGATCP